jgi:hypothetical protein
MKPKLCIVGQPSLISIGKKAASEFSDEAEPARCQEES